MKLSFYNRPMKFLAARHPQFGSSSIPRAHGDRAVVGLTTQVSRADAFDRQNAGLFARVGLTKHFGILTEHEVTGRQTSTGVQHLNTSGGDDTSRLSPSAQVRLTSNIKLSFDMLDVYAPSTSRAFTFSVQVKTQ